MSKGGKRVYVYPDPATKQNAVRAAKQRLAAAEVVLRERQDPSFLPEVPMAKLDVGRVGKLDALRVVRVVNETNMIAEAPLLSVRAEPDGTVGYGTTITGPRVWVTGYPTAGVTTRRMERETFEVTGTRDDADGTTMLVIRPVRLDDYME